MGVTGRPAFQRWRERDAVSPSGSHSAESFVSVIPLCGSVAYCFSSTRSRCIGCESKFSIECGGLASSHCVIGNAVAGGVSFTSRINLPSALLSRSLPRKMTYRKLGQQCACRGSRPPTSTTTSNTRTRSFSNSDIPRVNSAAEQSAAWQKSFCFGIVLRVRFQIRMVAMTRWYQVA